MRGNGAHEPSNGRSRFSQRFWPLPRIPFPSLPSFDSRRTLIAAGLAGALGLAALSTGAVSTSEKINLNSANEAAIAAARHASQAETSRSTDRTAQNGTSKTASTGKASTKTAPKKATKLRPTEKKIAPVAGLNAAQMKNAAIIIEVGQNLGMPRRAQVIAISTAMQESNLYNLASGVIPASRSYPHQGLGYDHDSLGMFQQRPASGWGTVKQLMNRRYQARAFYNALKRVNYMHMPVTYAAQAVQGSAFPLAYAKHVTRARVIVRALS